MKGIVLKGSISEIITKLKELQKENNLIKEVVKNESKFIF